MPANFSFLIPGVLAGSASPGTMGPLTNELEAARRQGIRAIVSLTEEPLPAAVLNEAGFKYLHLPVEDFTAPTLGQMREFCRFVDEVRGEGGAVLTHCRAGVGRTGTMLAAYLIKEGESAEQAIAKVRRKRPGSIETGPQQDSLLDFEEALRKGK